MIPTDPNTRLNRRDTAVALNEAGFPIAEQTLATKASRGDGPAYYKFGARVLYRWGDALEWAESRLSPPWRPVGETKALITSLVREHIRRRGGEP